MGYTLNDRDLLSCHLEWSRTGQWVATVEAASSELLTGTATIKLGAYSWVGEVLRGGVYAGRFKAVIVPAIGLLLPVAPKHLIGSLSDALDYLSRVSSVTFDLRSDTPATQWVITQGSVREALEAITYSLNLTWRAKRDGTIWVGQDAWESAPDIATTHVELDKSPSQNATRWAADETPLEPATTLKGERISKVLYELASGHLDVTAYFEITGQDRGTVGTTRLIAKEVAAPLRYHGLYPCKVVACDFANQTIDVRPEDPAIPDITKIPIRTGPGLRLEVANDQRVLVGFEGGRPDKPYASINWASDSQGVRGIWDMSSYLQVGAGTGQWVALANLVGTELNNIKTMVDALKTVLQTHQHSVAAVGSPTAPNGSQTVAASYTPSDVSSNRLKAT